MPITLEDVRHVAALASLELDEPEAARLRRDLHAILLHFERIADPGPAPASTVEASPSPLRPDEVTEESRPGVAPIVVPRVIDP